MTPPTAVWLLLAGGLTAGAAGCDDASPPALLGEDAAVAEIAAAYAAQDCARVVALAPDFSSASALRLDAVTFMFGRCAARLGQDAQAAELLARIAYQEPPGRYTVRALYHLGRAEYRLGRYEEAAADLARFGRRFGDRDRAVDAAYYLGKSLFRLDRLDQSLEVMAGVLDDAGAPEGRRAGASYYTGRAHHAAARAGVLDAAARAGQAAVWYQRVAAQHAGSSFADNARYQLAKLAYHRGAYAEAAEALERFLDTDASSGLAGAAHYFLGRAQQRRGAYARAIEVLAAHARLYPDSAFTDNARYQLGRSRYALALELRALDPAAAAATFADAATTFEALLAEVPGSPYAPGARYYLGRSLYRQAAYARARPHLAQVSAAQGSVYQDNALYYAGMCDYHLGVAAADDAALMQALARLESVAALFADSAYADDAAYFGARAVHRLGWLAQAALAYEAFVATYPNSSYADNAYDQLIQVSLQQGDCGAARDAIARMQAAVAGSDLIALAVQRLAESGC